MAERHEQQGMHKRRITLADGRYLIFYTFDDAPAPEIQGASERVDKSEPEPQAQAEEERRV